MRKIKKLEIVRPDLDIYSKNQQWGFDGMSLPDLVRAAGHDPSELSRDANAIPGATGRILFCQFRHIAEGAIVSVSKEVSLALEASAVSAKSLEDLTFPARSMEIIWEDQSLPNILVSLMSEKETVSGERAFVVVTTCKEKSPHGGHTLSCVSFRTSDIADVLTGKLEGFQQMNRKFDSDLTPAEADAMNYMAILALKVLAYASVPEVREAAVHPKTKSEMKAAHVFSRGRLAPNPVSGVIHLRTLPRVVTHSEPTEASGESLSSRRFLGRVGHIRHFRSDFYKTAKGSWKWIPPIAPPEGIKIKFIVNKAPNVQV